MKLDDYLRAIEECPDEMVKLTSGLSSGRTVHRLTADFGVYDNWPILTNADYRKVVEDLRKSGKWISPEEGKCDGDRHRYWFHYAPGTMVIQLQNWIPSIDCNRGLHGEEQRKLFNMGFCLHPYQEKKYEGVSRYEAQIRAIKDIAEYLKSNNFPFCFPKSRGWKNLDDVSQVVYWPDELHDKIQGEK